jgi:hypothetical protein
MHEQDFFSDCDINGFLIRILEGPDQGVVRCDSTKLMKMGFEYVYDEKKILDDSVACGRQCGALLM